jgi:hypothetical protein
MRSYKISGVKKSAATGARQKLAVCVAVCYEDGNVFEEMNNVQIRKAAR